VVAFEIGGRGDAGFGGDLFAGVALTAHGAPKEIRRQRRRRKNDGGIVDPCRR